MGLGLHGGGAAAAEYCSRMGAKVTVTDLRDEKTLFESLKRLENYDIRYVLGKHQQEDFTNTDIVIKNPAVPRNSIYLEMAREQGVMIETDLSIFLSVLHTLARKQEVDVANIVLIAVTGTKGKSSAASCAHHILQAGGLTSYLGGNITISPLLFLDDIHQNLNENKITYIILELSSFQIGDLRLVLESRRRTAHPTAIYWPNYALLTNILADHQSYYPNMAAYVADKAYLFRSMKKESPKIIGNAGVWEGEFLSCAGTISIHDPSLATKFSLPEQLRVAGKHQRENLAMVAALFMAGGIGPPPEALKKSLALFPGVEHRLQYLGNTHHGRVQIVNDSAATIPEACLMAVAAFQQVYLICGGTDKRLDLQPIVEAGRKCRAIYLLKGSASDILVKHFQQDQRAFKGPYDDIGAATVDAQEDIIRNREEKAVLLLSPGCASFGMFLNEFDRGRQFIRAAHKLPGFSPIE